jgi:hypothetical protein
MIFFVWRIIQIGLKYIKIIILDGNYVEMVILIILQRKYVVFISYYTIQKCSPQKLFL